MDHTVHLIRENVEGSDDSNQAIENRQTEVELGDEHTIAAAAVVSSGAGMWRVLAAGSDGPRPPPRCHHTTTLVGRRLLLMGGTGGHGVNHKLIHGWA